MFQTWRNLAKSGHTEVIGAPVACVLNKAIMGDWINFFFKNGHFRIFSPSFQRLTLVLSRIYRRWLDSNHRPLVLEVPATAQNPFFKFDAKSTLDWDKPLIYLMKRMTPKMFWMQGRKTPMMVPSLALACTGLPSGSAGPLGMAAE